MILDARRDLEARAASTAHGRDRVDRRADVLRARAAGQHEAAFGRARARSAPGPRRLPGQVDDGRDRLAAAQEHGVAAAHLALLGCVELHEVGAASRPPPRRSTATGSTRRAPAARLGARRGEPSTKMNPSRSAPASTAASTSSCAREAADLHERAREDLAQLRARVGGPHERRADEHGVGAGELRLRACARECDRRSPRSRRGRAARAATSRSCAPRSIANVDRSRALMPIRVAPSASRARARRRRAPRRACRDRCSARAASSRAHGPSSRSRRMRSAASAPASRSSSQVLLGREEPLGEQRHGRDGARRAEVVDVPGEALVDEDRHRARAVRRVRARRAPRSRVRPDVARRRRAPLDLGDGGEPGRAECVSEPHALRELHQVLAAARRLRRSRSPRARGRCPRAGSRRGRRPRSRPRR